MGSDRPRLLDLFCGAGGAAMGYHRAGFDVVGVDHKSQPHYPFEFHQGDAFEYLAEHGCEYDVIHASPPCQAYTMMRRITEARYGTVSTHPPDLIPAMREALMQAGKMWIIENVQGAPLYTQFILCGSMFGLRGLRRHRHFETNVLIMGLLRCNHQREETVIGVYGSRPDGRRVNYRQHKLSRIAKSIEEASRVMGIDWMSWQEIREAIPPAYTEWIGRRLTEILRGPLR